LNSWDDVVALLGARGYARQRNAEVGKPVKHDREQFGVETSLGFMNLGCDPVGGENVAQGHNSEKLVDIGSADDR
jgi:hypothetical protein